MSEPPHGPGRPNQTSFRRGVSGNPGGRPATAEVSALARRYTADWVRGLVGVVRLPVCRENAPSIVSAALALRDTGYPGLKSANAEQGGATSLHLHLLAVTRDAQTALMHPESTRPVVGTPFELADGPLPIDHELHEPILEGEEYIPPPDERLPHEALPLWDAAAGDPPPANGADDENQKETDDGNVDRGD